MDFVAESNDLRAFLAALARSKKDRTLERLALIEDPCYCWCALAPRVVLVMNATRKPRSSVISEKPATEEHSQRYERDRVDRSTLTSRR